MSSIPPPVHIPTPDWFDATDRIIVAGLDRIRETIQQVASAYVAAIDRMASYREHLADKFPTVPGGFWRNLERVGRGQLDGRIAAGGVSYCNLISKLTLSEQKQALDGTLQLLTHNGDTLQISLDNMAVEQARQVFAIDHIRSLPEQRAWLEAKALEEASVSKKSKASKAPVEIDRKHQCIIVNGYKLTVAELSDYVAKLTASR